MHKALFWVAVAVLQLDEVNLYSAGTALLEQNLHTLDTMRVFNDKVERTQYTVEGTNSPGLIVFVLFFSFKATCSCHNAEHHVGLRHLYFTCDKVCMHENNSSSLK